LARRGVVAAILATAFGGTAMTADRADCTLAYRPYSSRTILADLLANPAAKKVLDRDAPELFQGAPGLPAGPPPRSFQTIISPERLLALRPGGGEAVVARLDRDLARIRISRADAVARCARYDRVPPRLPARIGRPAILVFDKINGFRDGPSVDAATAALKAMAARRGWSIVFSDRGAVFNPAQLARFDAIVWNNVSGDALTMPQQAAFKAWLDRGGGFAGIHGSGGDPTYVWDWYADTLIGARFKGHPMNPQFQTARVRIADPASAITRGLGEGWSLSEEYYSFESSPRRTGAHVLATLDESTYSPVGLGGMDLRMGDHPIAWTKCIGNGRAFYTAIGHRPGNYGEPNSVRLLEQGIAWAAGQGETACRAGREVGRAGGK
jgi:type 1 glutamine amidotransferase